MLTLFRVIMATKEAAERARKEPNPIIDGRKANVNLAILGAKPRLNSLQGKQFCNSNCILAIFLHIFAYCFKSMKKRPLLVQSLESIIFKMTKMTKCFLKSLLSKTEAILQI